jgi:hypothetical protein
MMRAWVGEIQGASMTRPQLAELPMTRPVGGMENQ